jgi:aminoglycoside phosphotransferase (APT) family kinase protein
VNPSAAALAAMVAEVVPNAEICDIRRVGGGLAASTAAIDTSAGDFIVKIYRAESPAVPLEWESLTFAQRVNVPVPEPVALDTGGRWFGTPAIVMTRLPGRADVTPTDVDGWLRQIAHTLARIHQTDTAGATGALLRPLLGNRDVDWGIRSALADRCVEAIRRHPPRLDGDPIVMHGDFHPGNIVWTDGTLSGVVDWTGTRLGSRGFELAYCRGDIAMLFGMRAVRRFAEHYADRAGEIPADLPVFDLICGLAARKLGPSQWLRAFRQQGCTDSPRQFAARVTPFLRAALAELGA